MLGMVTKHMPFLTMSCILSQTPSVTPGKFLNSKFGILSLTNCRNGWGASAIDAFSTACVMQLPDVVNTILDYIPTIDFDTTTEQVSLFETTIRYLGGMLSGKALKHVIPGHTDFCRLRLPKRSSVESSSECYSGRRGSQTSPASC